MISKSAIVLCFLFPAFAGDLVVHEWGTFTSVAGERGEPVSWASLSAPSDLPCFVYRLSAQCVKCNATSLVRMETPVLYFYSPHPTTVSVHVDLPSGAITEWYPKASGPPRDVTYGRDGRIDWGPVQIVPGAAPDFLSDGSDSHYYPARNTDSVPLRVGNEQEKLLFYRGVADQGVAIEAEFQPDGKLELRNAANTSLPFAVLFEKRAGKTGYRVLRDLDRWAAIDPPPLTANIANLRRELASALTEAGLYPKEAAAMIDTWRDSWFEEGMRVFYILPRNTVDETLPLKVTPAPAATVRVFVGRVEILSPGMKASLASALATGDTATLERCGRFLAAFQPRIRNVVISPAAQAFIDSMRAQNTNRVSPCKEPLSLPTNQ
uniref:Uncharacterized protein n=1 Tax=Solibacter usitatus (strain Ellin6076) TaxID=234267 RepID=Q01XN5_SOLUE